MAGVDPSYWRYIAGVESADQLRGSRRPRMLAWTAAPESARGDIVVIYGKSPIQGYVALARQCHDPVLGSDDRHWTWLQIQPLKDDGLAQAKVSKGARTKDQPGLKKPAGGSYNRISPGQGRGDFLRMLTAGDQAARSRIEKWTGGRSPYPRNLSAKELQKAWWEPPEQNGLSDDHEEWLSEAIAYGLVRQGRGSWLEDGGAIEGPSLEHRLKRGPKRWGRADIVLVAPGRRTLIVVEVKKYACPSPGRDPISQVLTNRQALLDKHKGWKVRCLAVAPEFHQETLAQARTDRVECLRCDSKGGRLRPA